jgi:hypothetical protein
MTMKRLVLSVIVAAALAAGSVALVPQTEAKQGVDCIWAAQQLQIAQTNYYGCAARFGHADGPGHPCWSLYQTMWHYIRLIRVSCHIHEE